MVMMVVMPIPIASETQPSAKLPRNVERRSDRDAAVPTDKFAKARLRKIGAWPV